MIPFFTICKPYKCWKLLFLSDIKKITLFISIEKLFSLLLKFAAFLNSFSNPFDTAIHIHQCTYTYSTYTLTQVHECCFVPKKIKQTVLMRAYWRCVKIKQSLGFCGLKSPRNVLYKQYVWFIKNELAS